VRVPSFEVIRFAALTLAIATAACTTEDASDRSASNKGCLSNNCDYCSFHDCSATRGEPYDAGPAPPPFFAPNGCPKTRTDASRAGLMAGEVTALLPGLYLSCSRDQTIEITATEDGRLVVHGKSFIVSTCGTAQCDAVWGDDVGTLKIWTDPTAFTFTADGSFSASYVRSPD
jgi:hypothetical protein